ncbi:FBP domain-containing protein [Herbiconiux liangxiaofengii]|uniref:FBP domain-containing protein n=1 Tax=Herbiconiux liangxiaofengii TaxID=3342795 RepID=UPI0035B7178D
MRPLTEKQLRAAFINTSQRERAAIVPPAGLDALRWSELDYLGWRDRRQPNVGYVVVELGGGDGAADADGGGGFVGVMLRQTEARARSRPQCSWCDDVTLPNDVVFFGAKRAGQAGRNGDTVGALVCSEFECSANVRKLPPLAYPGFDREAARLQRIAALRQHATAFVLAVRAGG